MKKENEKALRKEEKQAARAAARASGRASREAKKQQRKAARAERRRLIKEWKYLPHAEKALIRQKRSTLFLDILKITAGTFLIAFNASVFMDPLGIVNGGVIGIGIVLKELCARHLGFDLPLALTNFALNLPLLIIGLFVKGKKYMGKTVLATLLLSVFLELTVNIRIPVDDYFLMAGIGGLICGVGVGLVVSANATTGGSDLFAAILQSRFKHLSVLTLLWVVDIAIVFFGLLVFDWYHSFYAIFTIILTSLVGDGMIAGTVRSKAVYIISDRWEAISDKVLHEMARGLTGLPAKGMFSGEDRTMLFCVISTREVVGLKRLVYEEDPDAFLIVTDAREVLGMGFENYVKE